MNYELITDSAALSAVIERFAGDDAVIVDTEFMRRDTYYPQPALVQLCFPGEPDKAWLIDPLEIDDVSPLRALFDNPDIIKVLHSASEDLEVFQVYLGTQPLPLFDTQRAAAFAGLGFSLGYRGLVELVSGLELAKGETRSDWLKRPLSDSQLDYAAADVIPLLPVYRHLRDKLDASGRSDWVLEDGAMAVAEASAPPAPSFTRVKSAWKLKPRQLAALALVCDWRDERARRLDKPKSWILADKVCLAMAQRLPTSIGELKSVPEMPQAVVRKQGEVLLELIDEARMLADDELPAGLGKPLDGSQRDELKKLKQAAADLARDWQVEPEALLPAKDYELMVRLAHGEALERPVRWSGWRQQALVVPLLALVGVEA
ncbi:MAG: ribonuclease D [Halieaceae bacterium]|nr:ribonuclease D [Halieaceae bacterium]